MLDLFRNQTKNPFIWLILGIIIVAFVLTFNTSGPITGGPGGVEVSSLIDVHGHAIDNRELGLAMSLSADPPPAGGTGFEQIQAKNRYEKSRMLFSGVPGELIPLTPFDGPVPPIKLEKIAQELIESILVANVAEEQGIGVSDAELNARVMRLQRIFDTTFTDDDGNFDVRKYDIFARYRLNTSKSQLESLLRREIQRDKIAHIVTAGVNVTDAELDAIELAETKRPRLQLIAIDAASARTAVKPTDEEVTTWAEGHGKEIQAAYEAAGEAYRKPAKWSVRGILLKAEPKDVIAAETDAAKKAKGEKEWQDKKAAADALKAELDKVWSGETAIDPPGDAQPLDTEEKAADGDAGAQKKITDVPEADRSKWLMAHFTKIAADKTEHGLTKDVGGQFIDDKSADALKLSPFGDAVSAALTAAEVGTLVGPVEGSHGWWIMVADKKTDAVETPLDTVKAKIARGLLQEERAGAELEKIAATVLATAAKMADKPLEDAAKAWNKETTGEEGSPLSATTAGPVGRSPLSAYSGGLQAMLGLPPQVQDPNDIPGIGKAPEIVAAAWKLNKDKPLADKTFKSADGKTHYVIRLDPPPVEDDAAKAASAKSREQLRDTVTTIRRVATWQAFVRKLRDQAETDGNIERNEAWTQVLNAERQRYIDATKRALANKKPAAGGSPINLQVGGQPIQLDTSGPALPEPVPVDNPAADKPAKPAADKPVEPAADKPAADKPAEAPAAEK